MSRSIPALALLLATAWPAAAAADSWADFEPFRRTSEDGRYSIVVELDRVVRTRHDEAGATLLSPLPLPQVPIDAAVARDGTVLLFDRYGAGGTGQTVTLHAPDGTLRAGRTLTELLGPWTVSAFTTSVSSRLWAADRWLDDEAGIFAIQLTASLEPFFGWAGVSFSDGEARPLADEVLLRRAARAEEPEQVRAALQELDRRGADGLREAAQQVLDRAAARGEGWEKLGVLCEELLSRLGTPTGRLTRSILARPVEEAPPEPVFWVLLDVRTQAAYEEEEAREVAWEAWRRARFLRLAAIRARGLTGGPEGVRELVGLTRSEDLEEAAEALNGIQESGRGGPKLFPVLARLARTPGAEPRSLAAIHGLGFLGSPRAIETLDRLLAAEDERARHAAAALACSDAGASHLLRRLPARPPEQARRVGAGVLTSVCAQGLPVVTHLLEKALVSEEAGVDWIRRRRAEGLPTLRRLLGEGFGSAATQEELARALLARPREANWEPLLAWLDRLPPGSDPHDMAAALARVGQERVLAEAARRVRPGGPVRLLSDAIRHLDDPFPSGTPRQPRPLPPDLVEALLGALERAPVGSEEARSLILTLAPVRSGDVTRALIGRLDQGDGVDRQSTPEIRKHLAASSEPAATRALYDGLFRLPDDWECPSWAQAFAARPAAETAPLWASLLDESWAPACRLAALPRPLPVEAAPLARAALLTPEHPGAPSYPFYNVAERVLELPPALAREVLLDAFPETRFTRRATEALIELGAAERVASLESERGEVREGVLAALVEAGEPAAALCRRAIDRWGPGLIEDRGPSGLVDALIGCGWRHPPPMLDNLLKSHHYAAEASWKAEPDPGLLPQLRRIAADRDDERAFEARRALGTYDRALAERGDLEARKRILASLREGWFSVSRIESVAALFPPEEQIEGSDRMAVAEAWWERAGEAARELGIEFEQDAPAPGVGLGR